MGGEAAGSMDTAESSPSHPCADCVCVSGLELDTFSGEKPAWPSRSSLDNVNPHPTPKPTLQRHTNRQARPSLQVPPGVP